MVGEAAFLTDLDLETRSVLIGDDLRTEVGFLAGDFDGDTLFITTSFRLFAGDIETDLVTDLTFETDLGLILGSVESTKAEGMPKPNPSLAGEAGLGSAFAISALKEGLAPCIFSAPALASTAARSR